MSLYAVKNADGKYINYIGEYNDESPVTAVYQDSDRAHIVAHAKFGRVVELVEKAEPVEVSENAGNTLADLHQEICYGETDQYAADYVRELHTADMSIEDIFRALDVGWTVKQPQRWYVKAPEEWDGRRGERQRFYKRDNDSIGAIVESAADNFTDEQFTADEIEHYHLSGLEKVEVED